MSAFLQTKFNAYTRIAARQFLCVAEHMVEVQKLRPDTQTSMLSKRLEHFLKPE
jgi:acyl CoA:acetate/3-ketoacid CoA transferase alpha subunit